MHALCKKSATCIIMQIMQVSENYVNYAGASPTLLMAVTVTTARGARSRLKAFSRAMEQVIFGDSHFPPNMLMLTWDRRWSEEYRYKFDRAGPARNKCVSKLKCVEKCDENHRRLLFVPTQTSQLSRRIVRLVDRGLLRELPPQCWLIRSQAVLELARALAPLIMPA